VYQRFLCADVQVQMQQNTALVNTVKRLCSCKADLGSHRVSRACDNGKST